MRRLLTAVLTTSVSSPLTAEFRVLESTLLPRRHEWQDALLGSGCFVLLRVLDWSYIIATQSFLQEICTDGALLLVAHLRTVLVLTRHLLRFDLVNDGPVSFVDVNAFNLLLLCIAGHLAHFLRLEQDLLFKHPLVLFDLVLLHVVRLVSNVVVVQLLVDGASHRDFVLEVILNVDIAILNTAPVDGAHYVHLAFDLVIYC